MPPPSISLCSNVSWRSLPTLSPSVNLKQSCFLGICPSWQEAESIFSGVISQPTLGCPALPHTLHSLLPPLLSLKIDTGWLRWALPSRICSMCVSDTVASPGALTWRVHPPLKWTRVSLSPGSHLWGTWPQGSSWNPLHHVLCRSPCSPCDEFSVACHHGGRTLILCFPLLFP